MASDDKTHEQKERELKEAYDVHDYEGVKLTDTDTADDPVSEDCHYYIFIEQDLPVMRISTPSNSEHDYRRVINKAYEFLIRGNTPDES